MQQYSTQSPPTAPAFRYREIRGRSVEGPPPAPLLDALSLTPDDVVVEVGAGDGHFTVPIAQHMERLSGNGMLFACDRSRMLTERLRTELTRAGVERYVRAVCLADARPGLLPFADERVETVLWVNALQYLPEPDLWMRETARILSPCGSAIVLDWQRGRFGVRDRSMPPPPAPEALYPMLDRAGLTVRVSLDLAGCNWAFRAMRPLDIAV